MNSSLLQLWPTRLRASFYMLSTLALLSACGGGGGGSSAGAAVVTSQERTVLAQTPPDPSADSEQPYQSLVKTEYEIGRIEVSDLETNNTYETDVHGYFTYASDAPTPMPVILLLHGRHQTCETSVGEAPFLIADDDNCPNNAAVQQAPSYEGYPYLADALAKAGYFVMSIDANDINDNDGGSSSGDAGANARAVLIKEHLDQFRIVNTTGATESGNDSFPELVGLMDFDRVGIMGHSRGGDGIARFVRFNRMQAQPHNLLAAFGLAPTDYNMEIVDGVTYAALLPYCDGDVEDVQGAFTFDDTRYADATDPFPKFQILTMGGNHNFFNRAWTTDDWVLWDSSQTDPHCGTNTLTNQRDSREEQEGYGLFFMASFFRAFVGGEPEYLTYWNGQADTTDNACPGFVGPCEARHHLTIHAGAPQRLLVEDFGEATPATQTDLGGALVFTGFDSVLSCDPPGFNEDTDAPCPSDPTFNNTPQIALTWTSPASIVASFPSQDVSNMDIVSLRLGVVLGDGNNAGGQDFQLRLTDAFGAEQTILASDFSESMFLPPGREHDSNEGGSAKTLLNAIDIPLTAFDRVDLGTIRQIDIVFDVNSAGSVQVADLLFQQTAL